MKKVIHYINQFFAGAGGEDTASMAPELIEGAKGPGLALNAALEDAEVTHTIVCGDNYMGENKEKAVEEILDMIKDIDFDFLIAGPAFNAGRYGVACGMIGTAVEEKLGKPAITSMNEENPGVEMYKKDLKIFMGERSAAGMKHDVKLMTDYANKLFRGDELGGAEENSYYPRGIRHQVWLEEPVIAAVRGVDMLVKKLNGEEYKTELYIEPKETVAPGKAIEGLSKAKIAVVTSGGIVPVDNPDRIQSASATKWGRYDVNGMDRLESGVFKTIHAGFDPAAANADPNVIVPLDVLREMEKEGVFGELHHYFYSTVGTGTTQADAARMGSEIAELLLEDGVDGVIMVST